jgi:hypothetical protein
MEQTDGRPSHSYRHNTSTPHTLRRVNPIFAERQRNVPRLGDIWIPKSFVSPNHFLDSTSRVWKIYSRLAIVLSGLSMRDQDLVSSVGGSGAIWKQSGSSSRSPQMSNAFLPFHRTLSL